MSQRKPDLSTPENGSAPLSEEDRAKVSGGLAHILDITMGRRLAHIRDEVGSDTFVQAVGRSGKQISRYEKGDDVPFSVVERVAEAFRVSFGWLAYGQSLTDVDANFEKGLIREEIKTCRAVLARRNLSEVDRQIFQFALEHWEFVLAEHRDREVRKLGSAEEDVLSATSDNTAIALPKDVGQPNFIRLPVFSEVHASAGYGSVPVSELANNVIAFDRTFLRDQGGNPDRCSIIFARGTSMKPTIPDGAILVVDHSQRDVAHGCIYVFNVSDQLLVKRARWRMDGRLELVSDNIAEDYPVETFGPDEAHELRVVGRVVYFCRTP